MNKSERVAKPFLKWAGGKTQLLNAIEQRIPEALTSNSFTYIEPFVGGGAVLFWMLTRYQNLKKVIINDVNYDLINCYKTLKTNVDAVLLFLEKWQDEYYSLSIDEEKKKLYYYKKRDEFNIRNSTAEEQCALFIFLNRTCFNGLYRVNRKNLFNVPIGSYKKPRIFDPDNLVAVSEALKNIEILNTDFTGTLEYAGSNTLFYFDPPYKPLNTTSNFNSYAKDEFDDKEQIRLKEFCSQLNNLSHTWLLSNSDVKSVDPNNHFFDDLYKDFNIQRVEARRAINSKASKRGKLSELLISNVP